MRDRHQDLERLAAMLRERGASVEFVYDDVYSCRSGEELRHDRILSLLVRGREGHRSLRVRWTPVPAVFVVPDGLAWPADDPRQAARLITARLGLAGD